MDDIGSAMSICAILFFGLWIFTSDERTSNIFFLLFSVSWVISTALLLVNPKPHQAVATLNNIDIPREVMLGITVIGMVAIPIIFIAVRRNQYR